jgi:hypothetical protein
MKKMVGRVGRTACDQLRGLLHSQQLKLKQAESNDPRNEKEITNLKLAIEDTMRKLKEKGC